MNDTRQAVERPDVKATLAGLKDFQRNTVDHVHSRFFDPGDPARRFLVADEVGLGKTLVARGVTAKLVDELWRDVDRIDVVYICSNAAIAAQNIRRLQIAGGTDFTKATRLTLLPRVINDLRGRKLNFVSLTPGTSFSQHSATGTGEERALIYLMLREAWDFGERKPPINVFCHQKTRRYFEWDIAEILNGHEIDPDLCEDFVRNLEGTTLRDKFEETQSFFQRRQWGTAPEEGRRLQHELIDQLRRVLSRSCVDALEPDLVILDEFQRFQHLLELDEDGRPTSDAGELAHQLFGYSDPESGEHARTLLLSATPYTAFGVDPEDPDSSHHQAFTETVSFLLDDPNRVERLKSLFRVQRDLILDQASDETPGVSAGAEIREILLRCMCRTERLGATADRDGMLTQIPHPRQALEPEDIVAYTAIQGIGRDLGVSDMVEFWKSSPYLLNMMDGYKFDRALSEKIDSGQTESYFESLRDGAPGVLDRGQIDRLEKIDPGNARLRELWGEIEKAGAVKLLWLNPSLPYYEPGAPFDHEGAKRFTKRLVFSNWMVVPKAVSSVLSYLTEQALFDAGGRGPHNYEDQARTAGSLKTLFRLGRVAPSFALVYPSRTLSEIGDPLISAGRFSGPRASEEVLEAITCNLREPLPRIEHHGDREGKPDQAWYWAAPILLDAEADREKTIRFLDEMYAEDPAFRGEESPDDDDDTETQWSRCLEAAKSLLDGELSLGRQPDDLAEVMAKLALGGFGNCGYRSLTRNAGSDEDRARTGGLITGLALRAMFNLPHATHLLQSLQARRSGPKDALWQECLDYAIAGNLQATLDEFTHLLIESQGSDREDGEEAAEVTTARAMTDAIGLRTTTTSASFFDLEGDQTVERERKRLRTRFAASFVKGQSDDAQEVERVEHLRSAFNSPFWPFILTSTSVGQEGLDFHLYCHAVVHWNLPSNPVDLEQREGRVHRYKNHAVRRNLALVYGEATLRNAAESDEGEVWEQLFKAGEDTRPDDQTDLWPYWLFAPDADGANPFLIERHVMAMALSRDEANLQALLKSLVLYRSVLGQPRQEDLVTALEKSEIEDLEAFSQRTRIDLSPPSRGGGTRPTAFLST